jgi:hypothetical protein
VGQRYRIIYKLQDTEILVAVVCIGIRKEGDKKDVYEVAKKLARLGLLDIVTPPGPDMDDEPEILANPEVTDSEVIDPKVVEE